MTKKPTSTGSKPAKAAPAARSEQASNVATLGQAALAGEDLSELFKQAVALVAATLQVEYCKVLELVHAGDALRLVAGVGWKDGLVGQAFVGLDHDSEAGFILLNRKPVIIENLAKDPRFTGSVLLRDHGIVSGISVILGTPEKPFGIMGAHTKRRRLFTEDEVNFFQTVANVLATAVQRKEAEEALRDSEANYRALFEQVAVGVAQIETSTGRFVQTNRRYCEIVGYTEEELQRMTFQEITHPEDLPADMDNMQRLLAGEIRNFSLEKRYLRKDGTIVWANLAVSPPWVFGGSRAVHTAVIEDISQRKWVDEELRRNERVLQMFVEYAPAAIAMLDRDMTYIAVSHRFRRDYGLGERSLVGRSHYEVFPEMAEHWKAIHQRCLEGAVEKCEEERFSRTDGGVDWMRWEMRPWHESAGEIGGIVLFSEVTTGRREAEERLREQASELAHLYSTNPLGLGLVDSELKFLRINERLAEMNGLSVAGHIGHSLRETFPNLADIIEPICRAVLETGQAQLNVEVHGTTAADPLKERDWLVSYRPITEAKRTSYVGMIVEDITERKQAEDARRRFPRQLMQAQDEERRRIAKELHDSTAQDLVAVMMNLALLQEGTAEGDAKAGEILADSVALVENCASEIRTLSYLLHPPRLDEAGLRGGLQEFAAGFGKRAGIEVTVEVPAELGRLPEEMEIALFRVAQQCLGNVLRHAQSPTAAITIRTGSEEITLEVADKGCGLPPDFAKNHGSARGDGVGIAGMRDRLEQFGGRLELDSSGSGTTVRAILPFKKLAA